MKRRERRRVRTTRKWIGGLREEGEREDRTGGEGWRWMGRGMVKKEEKKRGN